MKILLVIDSLGSGGSQRQMVNLAVAFREKGNEVAILVYHPHLFYSDELRELEISIDQINESNYVARLIKMRKSIRASNADIVLSFLEAPNFICEVAGLPWRKWKLIIGERSANPRIIKTIKSRALRLFHFFADEIIANSYENIKLIKKANPLLKSSKLHVVLNIVDFSVFSPDEDFVFRKEGILTLLVPSSHQHLKNLDKLIESMTFLSMPEVSGLRVVWYGDIGDDSFEKAEKKINRLKLKETFSFFPATRNIGNIMQQSDVVGIFSLYEGLPNAICEAMACGKPVIASSVGDLPRHIKDERLLFIPEDPKSIAEVLKYVLRLSKDEFIMIGERNYSYARENFSKNRIVNDYLKILREA
ncbi:MAG: glycosyltransferase family 4 protein [Bacteroidales bacterium]|jgi:glycosyltransferase involved in cell wall biosynthesis|nr:glycosyltransferase family 4 protein [Bacteroidales bacterium]